VAVPERTLETEYEKLAAWSLTVKQKGSRQTHC